MAADELIETWLPVPGFEGLYEVSDAGRVASTPKRTRPGRRILAPANHKRGGYLYVTLHRPGKQFHRKIHHLVCEAFNGPRPAGTLARHLDGNHLNNSPGNLAWGTASENNVDRVRHGRHHNANKRTCVRNHPLCGDNLYINATSGARQCRACQHVSKDAYTKRKRATGNAR